MALFKIAYIDESEIDIRRFQRFTDKYFEVIPIIPQNDIKDTCNRILESHVDAIVTDFDFAEQLVTVHYDGTDLVKEFLKKRENFPVFILTSFEDDANSKSDDVNIVYEKIEMDKEGKLLEKIKLQIEKYKHKLERDENRIIFLIEESQKRPLDALEKEELAELDSKVEKALDKESRIPNDLKNSSEANGLSELLKKVDELTKKLESK